MYTNTIHHTMYTNTIRCTQTPYTIRCTQTPYTTMYTNTIHHTMYTSTIRCTQAPYDVHKHHDGLRMNIIRQGAKCTWTSWWQQIRCVRVGCVRCCLHHMRHSCKGCADATLACASIPFARAGEQTGRRAMRMRGKHAVWGACCICAIRHKLTTRPAAIAVRPQLCTQRAQCAQKHTQRPLEPCYLTWRVVQFFQAALFESMACHC